MLKVDKNGIIFENEYYTISVQTSSDSVHVDDIEYHDYYEVLNVQTGVVELKHPSLPVVLHNAERWSLDLENEQYLWARAGEAEEEVTLMGEDIALDEPTVN